MSHAALLSAAQREFLDGRHYAIIATLNADGTIQQTVVWYMLDGDELRFSIGAESVKAANLRRNPTISITIEDGIRYLTLKGAATVEASDPELRSRLAQRYLGPERAADWLTKRPDAPRASVRVRILRTYGQGVN
ncbi:MAG: PPOX class F420-dependent oxidoreductase [Candidatus Viridilinea halotolerans]|uniref:PPOX class F420-dependent oxidoreductase n=1 Tax=Candidatus Viridilinea halotolerans TaxID=2491704 RepID=A0A426UAY7_9CHLR|nr:MAG: PPOX class F420-dependent oxidoreductase [Candidatus Viridilinea halotolerans]